MTGAVRDRPLQRPSDSDALRGALRLIRRRVDVPFAFGGQISGGELRLTGFDGANTAGLHNLLVKPEVGLGGRVMADARPAGVNDYAHATTITHDYDRPVLAEGLRSIVAAPVTVRGTVRGLLYAGVRGSVALGERATDVLVDIARQLGGEMFVRDEVDRRVKLIVADEENQRGPVIDADVREEVRDLQCELRRLAQAVESPDVRDQLRRASDRLANLGKPKDGVMLAAPLSPRELDVLAEVALGCSNSEIARRLSLTPETVKAYLRSATRKLEVSKRGEAVVAARRLGLLL